MNFILLYKLSWIDISYEDVQGASWKDIAVWYKEQFKKDIAIRAMFKTGYWKLSSIWFIPGIFVRVSNPLKLEIIRAGLKIYAIRDFCGAAV